MKFRAWVLYFLCWTLTALTGCATLPQRDPAVKTTAPESRDDLEKSLQSATEAISGQKVTEKDLRRLSKDIREDPATRSAVEAVTDAVSGQPAGVKYCPVDGRRFSPTISICPEHKVELKVVK